VDGKAIESVDLMDLGKASPETAVAQLVREASKLGASDVFFSAEEKAANSKLCTCVSRVAGGSITVDTPDREGRAA